MTAHRIRDEIQADLGARLRPPQAMVKGDQEDNDMFNPEDIYHLFADVLLLPGTPARLGRGLLPRRKQWEVIMVLFNFRALTMMQTGLKEQWIRNGNHKFNKTWHDAVKFPIVEINHLAA
ncbi:hypothetical protein NDU88_005776 [Pleurodeles waltl]|uniref:Uncharacterized protein n=1 Tax=Pleurodeles waltl TaxID=8319 RepID=A0AAV7TBQ6_PLEWA|nr:hypothetical protein NDU88_005776 [Pleurodeles waltl]